VASVSLRESMHPCLAGLLFVAVSAGRSSKNLFAEASKSRRYLTSIDPHHLGVQHADNKNFTAVHPVHGPISHELKKKGHSTVKALQQPSSSIVAKLEDEKNEPAKVESDGKKDEVIPEVVDMEKAVLWSLKDLYLPFCKNCKGIMDYQKWMEETGNAMGTKMTLVALSMLLVWLLGTTARDFFVPPLLYWSERLELRPAIAGATLLGFGNGAPDIFAAILAAQKDDLPLALSEMFGANMFTLCVTGGSVVLACHYYYGKQEGLGITSPQGFSPMQSSRRVYITILFYFLSQAALAWSLMQGPLHISTTMCLPALYGVYLVFLHLDSRKSDIDGSAAIAAAHGQESEDLSGEAPPLIGLYPPKDETSRLQYALWLICLPTYIIRWICIPPVDKHWGPLRRIMSSISPIGIWAFCVLTNAEIMQLHLTTLIGMTMLAVLGSFSMYLSSTDKPELPWFYPILPCLAMLSAILWLGAIAGEVTSLVEAIGFYMQVPRLRLGFSTIAWGNCLGDLLICVATVRQGQSDMAISAVLAGPLIDDLIAFGLALSSVAWRTNELLEPMCGQACPMELKLPIMTSVFFVCSSVSLFVLILRGTSQRPQLGAGVLFTWYALFLCMVIFVMHADAPEGPEKKAKE